MKDWKTYAIIALVAWCAWLTWKSAQRQHLDPEEVWDAYETAQRTQIPSAQRLKPTTKIDVNRPILKSKTSPEPVK